MELYIIMYLNIFIIIDKFKLFGIRRPGSPPRITYFSI